MAGISGILGNASGLDSEALIQAILAARQQAIDSVQERINKEDDKKEGYLAVQSSLANMQEIARRLHNGTAFNASIIQSSNASKLLATGTTTSLEGTFSFFAHSLASVSQYVSNGFFNTASAKVTNTPGTMTVEIGNARLYRPTDLDALNGSTGIDRGKIRITDDTGTSTVIDLTNVVTIDDVIDKINSNGTVQVEARVNDMIGSGLLGQGLVIENASGAGTIKVENVGFGSTATSLGIEGTNAMGVIVGTRINSIGVQTSLASLNDGRGVGDGMSTLGILTITGSGAAINVDLTDAKTMGDVVTLINAQAGTVTASLSGTSIKLSDAGMPASITVSGLSATMDSLGIDSAMLLNMGGGDFLGRPVIASLNSVLTSS
ncbi:MAG: hypothetical protein L6Q71_10600, partial [Planctomycetes bacterium]|nr:hypothetical protein [Planctomycetota bacterium]